MGGRLDPNPTLLTFLQRVRIKPVDFSSTNPYHEIIFKNNEFRLQLVRQS
jgi:hypothetical protein